MAQQTANRIEMNLDRAIRHALRSIRMRERGMLHNIFSLVGPPGGGKTMMIRDFAEKLNIGILSYEPGLERPEKLGGIPDIKWKTVNREGKTYEELHTIWSVPQMICEVREESPKHKNLIVLFDDWHLADDEIQRIGFELFTYYSLNGHKLPRNVVFILAGNEKSAAGAKVQMSAIRNRSTVIYVKSDPNYWIDNFATPQGIHPAGVSFFMMKGNQDIFHEEESTSMQFASPRSWTSAFNNLTDIENDPEFSNSPKSEKISIIQGCVGEKAAARFFEYYDIYSKIDTNKVFMSGVVEIPTDPIQRYAFSSAICADYFSRYIEKKTGKRKPPEGKKPMEVVFAEVMKTLHNTFPEIAVKCVRYFSERPRDPESGINGVDILKEMISNKFLERELLVKFRQTAGLVSKGADV